MATTIGQYPVKTPSGIILLPVVAVGDSILPSKCRVRVAGKTGELSLVYPDDVRASQIAVRQGGATYRVAKDARREITHTGSWSRSGVGNLSVGSTEFNRVTEIRANFTASARLYCNAVHIGFDPTETLTLRVRLKAGSYTSNWVTSSKSGKHYGEFQSNSFTHSFTNNVVLSGLPPGIYAVTVELSVSVSMSRGSGAGYRDAKLTVNNWIEFA